MRNINKTLNTVCLMLMISFIYIMIVSSVNNERMLMKPKEEKFQQISLFDIKCMIDEKRHLHYMFQEKIVIIVNV